MARSSITKIEKALVTAAMKRITRELPVEDYGFKAAIVAALAETFKELGIKENPPPRSSVQRWFDDPIGAIPTLQRFLVLEMTFDKLRAAQATERAKGKRATKADCRAVMKDRANKRATAKAKIERSKPAKAKAKAKPAKKAAKKKAKR